MKDIWLVINEKPLLLFKDKFTLHDSSEKAYTYAKSVGFEDPYGMGVNDAVGVLNLYGAEHMVSVIHLQVAE